MHLQAAAAAEGAAAAILAGEGFDSSLCIESRTSQASALSRRSGC
jgi:hypothetical protein